ncbi:MAG: FMN-binding protein, partial [Planctomycetota bacterium]|nr:FMN-binding protein [Planctomycetota bacterium]
MSFYKQEETPGLGGEIASKDFTDRFIKKKLFDAQGQPALTLVRPGSAKGEYELDAISGATMTSDKVQALITAAAKKFT